MTFLRLVRPLPSPSLTLSPGMVRAWLARTLTAEREGAELHPAVAAHAAHVSHVQLLAWEAADGPPPPWPTLAVLLSLYGTPESLLALARRLMEEADLCPRTPPDALAA